ncbi:MAG TPA: ParB/RepB/Spo0J family partition protein [Pirellulales bacterium]|nr:ParB/RepB/Spo0J family partition protein [Pirellulales bacterium]
MQRKLDEICPSPENDKLYRPVDASDPEIIALADSIREIGVREPIVVTLDGWILSGHRRYASARLAKLEYVPCRIEPMQKSDDLDRFMQLLREYNRQREKSSDEKLREELVTVDPHDAYESLIAHRRKSAAIATPALKIVGRKTRKRITAAKQPMLDAIERVLEERRDFWPLSDRQIHYALLNDPPLTHAAKSGSRYRNDKRCYNSLTELLTRARLAGKIPMNCIADETRGVTTWTVHRDVRGFMRDELDGFLKGYWRDLLQSQPNHIEILAEKNTLIGIILTLSDCRCVVS